MKEVEEVEEEVDWDQERRASKRVLECLEHDNKQLNVKRKFILRNWPEDRGRNNSNKFQPNSSECVPELLQRENEEPSLRSLNAFVGRSLSTLLKHKILRKRTAKKKNDALTLETSEPLLRITDGATNQSTAIVRVPDESSEKDQQLWRPPKRTLNLQKMEDAEIVTLLPCILETLNIPALQSILTVTTGVPSKSLNRQWLEDRIVHRVNEFLEDCNDTLPEVVNEAIEIIRDESSARQALSSGELFQLPSDPILAIQSALGQVESLPLRTLHAMYELVHEKEYKKVRLDESVTGGNRARLARSLRKEADRLLTPDEPVPKPLLRALRAMSLSAKSLNGNDGNIISIIGRPPPEVEAVHNKLLVTLSQLKNLESQSLNRLAALVHEGPVQSYCRDHPTYLRSHFRRVVLDFLLRCDDPEVPVPIQSIIDAVAVAGDPKPPKVYQKKPKKPDRVSKRSMWRDGERNGDEVEAVLQISSHLQQMVRDREEGEELDSDQEEDDAIRTAGDEAGALCYAIVGQALEARLPQSKAPPLPLFVQKYLHGGGFHRDEADENTSPGEEVDLLMKIAESLPGVSTRALQKMKNRLGLQ